MKSKPVRILVSFLLASIASTILDCAKVQAQRPQFEDFFELQNQATPPPLPNRRIFNSATPVQYQTPPEIIRQPEIIYNTPANLGQPIDTFQTPAIPTQSAPFPLFPYEQPDPFGSGLQPYQNQPIYPSQQAPSWGTNQPGLGYQGTNSSWLPSVDWNSLNQNYLQPLMERTRARQTYIYGGSKENQLGINDIEIATTLTRQDFLRSNQPLRISPGFIFHWWHGPNSIVNPGFDLPPQAYSIFLNFDHVTNPANQVGLENSFTVGYYTDFKNQSTDGIRFTGRLLGWTRLNSYTIAKLGIEYFDRVHVKMLPAFGIFMTPNSDLKLDFSFPKAKLAHRLPNLNDIEAWAYVGGEYGGGSWVIERTLGMDDQVDINDIRTYAGIEWMGPKRVTGFFEAGYVFDREILYRSAPSIKLDLADSFMIRSGFAF